MFSCCFQFVLLLCSLLSHVKCRAGKKLGFFRKKVFRFLAGRFFKGLMYEDRTQNYDQEIHKEYLIHDTLISMPHHL